jgi:hypothetical protein
LTSSSRNAKPNPPPGPRQCFSRGPLRAYQTLLARSRSLKRFRRCMAQGQMDKEEAMANELDINCTVEGGEDEVRSAICSTQAKMDLMLKKRNARQCEAARSSFQTRLSTKPEQAFRSVFQPASSDLDRPPLLGLRDPEIGTVHTNPDEMNRISESSRPYLPLGTKPFVRCSSVCG